ncbi:MAG: histidine kinase [Undibacterium sp.]|nr:histidine kinase [Undibacterium sp.]
MAQRFDHVIATDQAIPNAIAGKFGSWGSRAQQYPVFSQTWFKYRALSYSVPMVFLALILIVASIFGHDGLRRWFYYLAELSAWLSVAASLLLGRWLAVRIRLRGWPGRKEAIGITLALCLGIIVAQGFFWFSQPQHIPTVQAEMERIEALKATKKIDAEAGVQVEKKTDKDFVRNAVVNHLLILVLFIWWGGSLDLIDYFKQRHALQEALQQQEIDRYKKERNEAELRLSVLASQIEPHFLFNTLSGVRSAILSDPARGVAIIDHLVDYLRSTIPQMRDDGANALVTLDAQLNAIRAYLGVIHFRIPRLSFSVDSDPALAELTIPPLMLISLVENAVKHGIELKKGPVHIAVTAKRVLENGAEVLALCVSDNGVGFGATGSGSGIGLTNIRERLKQLYGNRASLLLETNEDGGVLARIFLPVSLAILAA